MTSPNLGPDGVQVIHALLLATFSLPMKCFRSEKYSLPNFPSVSRVLYSNNFSYHCSNEGTECSISVLPYLLLTKLDRAFNDLWVSYVIWLVTIISFLWVNLIYGLTGDILHLFKMNNPVFTISLKQPFANSRNAFVLRSSDLSLQSWILFICHCTTDICIYILSLLGKLITNIVDLRWILLNDHFLNRQSFRYTPCYKRNGIQLHSSSHSWGLVMLWHIWSIKRSYSVIKQWCPVCSVRIG